MKLEKSVSEGKKDNDSSGRVAVGSVLLCLFLHLVELLQLCAMFSFHTFYHVVD